MADVKVTAVVVVYNKEINDSVTCRRIQQFDPGIDVLVVDNSDVPDSNRQACEMLHFGYLSMQGNRGLSKAYNAAVDFCAANGSEVILLLDDDTEITEEYFQILQEELAKHPDVDIFAPVVKGQDGIYYSPNEFHFLRNHFITDPDQEISPDKFNAIASCLAIRMRVFDGYRFNETLFVDQVDQYFFCEQRRLGRSFRKLNTVINQNFYQRGGTLTPEVGWKRLRLRIYDIFRHARLMGGGGYIGLALIKCCGLGLQIGRKTKSVSLMLKAGVLSLSLVVRNV